MTVKPQTVFKMNGNVRILKIVINDFSHESRDLRELSVYREMGAEVAVVAKGEGVSRVKYREFFFDVYRLTTKPLGERIPKILNRFVTVFLWVEYIRKIEADVFSCHDLIALTIGWLCNIGRSKKSKLIYDSHEFEMGRNVKRNSIQKFIIKHWERFLISDCVFSIVVNDSIADEEQRIHGTKDRPIVIRNIPEYWVISKEVCKQKRMEILERMKGGEKVSKILMFHGNLGRGNGIETIAHALGADSRIGIVLMGQRTDESLINDIIQISEKYNATDRLLIIPAVSYEDIWKYLGAADVGMMMVEPIVKSYYYTLPNKLFECIQATIPIIASDLPEIKRIIERYDIGIVCTYNDVTAMKKAVNQLCFDRDYRSRIEKNLTIAKEELCWENEKQILISAAKRIV